MLWKPTTCDDVSLDLWTLTNFVQSSSRLPSGLGKTLAISVFKYTCTYGCRIAGILSASSLTLSL